MCSVHHLACGRRYLRLRTLPILKIAVSVTSLILCLISPTDDRENSERRAKRYRALAAKNSALFLRLLPKKVFFVLEKVDLFPNMIDCLLKKIVLFPKVLYYQLVI